jgi:hypothetical protein
MGNWEMGCVGWSGRCRNRHLSSKDVPVAAGLCAAIFCKKRFPYVTLRAILFAKGFSLQSLTRAMVVSDVLEYSFNYITPKPFEETGLTVMIKGLGMLLKNQFQ